MTQIIWTVLVLIVGALLGIGLAGRYGKGATKEQSPIVLGNIETLADLVTLRVPVSKVQSTHIGGYVGGIDCILLINGDVEISVDLKQARWENVNTEARTATLILNEPDVRRVRLDHEQTSVYTINRKGLWLLLPSAEPARQIVNRAMTEAQKCMESVGEDTELVERSKQQTEKVLEQFFKAINWRVEVRWIVKPTELDSS